VLRKHDIQFVKETIAPHSSPLLSVYVDVDPGKADNARRAWLVRVRNTVKGLRVPDGIAEKVIQALEFERPEARTYVLFAAQDLLRIYKLQVDLPVVDLGHGRVEGR
jgi:hypothetical protein